MTHVTNDVYSARFHARYHRVINLTFGYSADLSAQAAGDQLRFHGQADLGWYAGGVYHYEGSATASDFHSTYSSRYDHGDFILGRPLAGADVP